MDSDLCLHTVFLVAAATALAFHVSGVRADSRSSHLSLEARLGGALDPLSLRTPKQWSLAS